MSRFVSLMYHNVCARSFRDGVWPGFSDLSPSVTSYFVDQETFSRHCLIVSSAGECSELESSSSKDPKTSDALGVQITFDDGWRGTIDEAGPLLQAHGLTAVMFVTSDLIGHPYFADRHQLAEAMPTFSIGAHGRTHRPLATLPDHEIREELATSKATLEDIPGARS